MNVTPQSIYLTKKGVEMVQINISVKRAIAEDFITLTQGDSKSVIFTQIVREKKAAMIANGTWPKKSYSILGK